MEPKGRASKPYTALKTSPPIPLSPLAIEIPARSGSDDGALEREGGERARGSVEGLY